MNRVLLIIFIFYSNAILPCTCIGKTKVKSEVKNSDVVIIGKVLSKELLTIKDKYVPEEFYLKKNEYTIQIIKKYKGEITSDTIKIVTGIGNGDCGFKFLIGESYIIYSEFQDAFIEENEKEKPFLTTNICTRTRLYDEDEDRKIRKYLKRNRCR